MPIRKSAVFATLILASTFAVSAQAQTKQLHLGARLAYHFDAEEAGVGVQLGIPLARHVEFYPSIDNYFVDNGSLLSFNADLKFRVPLESTNWLYLGTGLNLARRSIDDKSNTRSGLNLFLGAESLKGRVHPFGEIRVVTQNGSSVQGVVGLNFTMHD